MSSISSTSAKDYWLYVYLANGTFFVFFARIAEIVPVLGKIHINLLVFIFTFAWLFIGSAFTATEWKKNKALHLILFLLLVGLVTVPFAVWPGNAFAGWKERLLINNTIIIFFCFIAIQNEKQLITTVQTFLLGIVVLVVALLLIPHTSYGGRPHVTDSYDANDLALFFAVSFPFFFSQFWIRKTKGKIVVGLLCCMIILAVLKTGSRGGIMALAVGILLLLFSSKIKVKFFYKVCVLLLVGAFLVSPQAEEVTGRWAAVISGEDYNLARTEDHGGGRLSIWSSGLILFGENFITGVGVGNSGTAMGERYGRTAWMTMHNSYLQIALELGVFGFLIFLLMFRAIWRNCTEVIAKTRNDTNKKQMLILAASLRTSLIVYMVGAFFLSQAYSILIPFFLVISDRLHFFAVQCSREEL